MITRCHGDITYSYVHHILFTHVARGRDCLSSYRVHRRKTSFDLGAAESVVYVHKILYTSSLPYRGHSCAYSDIRAYEAR